MTERDVFYALLYGWTAVALIFFVLLFFVSAPYGRHNRAGWGPEIQSRLGWLLMEAPSPIGMVLLFILGDRHTNPVSIALLGLWLLHYVNRAFVFPFRMRGGQKPMPLFVALSAVLFNSMNSYLNGRWLFLFSPAPGVDWLLRPRFVAGACLFLAGFYVNLQSDAILRRLRAPGETGYKIPRGGLYKWVSSPNYFGELVEWTGFVLCSWSLAAVTFAVWTAANLLPRALSNHRWYKSEFPDYPRERRVVFPFLW